MSFFVFIRRLPQAALLVCLAMLPLQGPSGTDNHRTSYKTCKTAPPGMACVLGGNAFIGRDPKRHAPPPEKTGALVFAQAKPLLRVDLETFYIDKNEITNGQFLRCLSGRVCRSSRSTRRTMQRAPRQSARLTWRQAHDYCRWAGKRLPTEAEWEKAARGAYGDVYPWGDGRPTCARAHFRGCDAQTRRRPGHYGLYNLAGGLYEWVNDWATPCRVGCKKACGAPCRGTDPLGPCDGLYPCNKRTRKILKGGDFKSSPSELPAYLRRVKNIRSGRFGARCAVTNHNLYQAPGWMLRKTPPRPPVPGKPTPGELHILHNIKTDVLDKPFCPWRNSSRAYCRDKRSYVKSNEGRRRLFAPYIRNLGGGYTGVGADANYTFISLARSEWVWLFDYDPTIVNLHRLIRVLVLASPRRWDFTRRFERGRYREVAALVKKKHKGHERRDILRVYRSYRAVLYKHYRSLARRKRGSPTWLRTDQAYGYIRLLFTQNRIAVLKGDLLKDHTMRGIGKAARVLGTSIRIYYPSNAEEYWSFSPTYRANVRALPFDERSVVLRTFSPYRVYRGIVLRWHPRRRGRYWHYVVHGAQDFATKLARPAYDSIDAWKYERLPTRVPELDIIRLPGSL